MNTQETLLSTASSETSETSETPKVSKVAVVEIFGPTIQGEGIMIGWKTMFIRFGGCDSRCGMCDSLHAVLPEAVKANSTYMTQDEIFEAVTKIAKPEQCEWVTLSGGNPAIWELGQLVSKLRVAGYQIAVETQGTEWREWLKLCDLVTVSPKSPGMLEPKGWDQIAFEFMLEELYHEDAAVCVKIPIFSQLDIEFAVGVETCLHNMEMSSIIVKYLSVGNSHPPKLDPRRKQMLDSTVETNLVGNLLTDYRILLEQFLLDKRLPQWRFTPQLHVLLWGNKAGV